MAVTRRQLVAGASGLAVVAGGCALALRYGLGRQAPALHLTAAEHAMPLVPGCVTPAWAYTHTAPCAELRVRQGERLHVRFHNRLPVATTVHWHGIRLPLEMDGVPYVSQMPVLPGEYFDYRFKVPDAGSYWYHPHVASAEQLGRGLVAPLIVEEREPTGFAHERTLSLKNWHVDERGAFMPFSVAREAARNGTLGRLSSINGVPQGTLDVPAGEVTRVRLLNLDNTATYRINLRGEFQALIYAIDGNPIMPRPLRGDYWLGPGMRLCLAVRAPAAGGEVALRDGPVRLGTLRSVPGDGRGQQWPPALPPNPLPEPDLAHAQTLVFNFEWAGKLSVGTALGRAPSLWQVNGVAWDIDDKTCAERPIARLQHGRSYILELRNLTQYQHPIHLHGMSFKVLASNKRHIEPYFTDTFLLGRNERAQVALVADNPGTWMFHCHVIDHMETGLMAAIEVS
ncbi:multicopper oxidase family protein [Pseudomonas typographi]|uniref:Multicopper oxidase family protein n=1 Tax=Pseudomonas typographi TaxID=2715964 RepID=A0ABR7Z9C3_9PSED|nr:multicopper oxidase family protein [Pseudomonas typographi]MBD1554437.1 multicopper oxidase family protein [Pseudomonas typographi]MBD1589925.1 multicopper oxidase family protein [Pseudomonas typographi]MBD1602027.1 multicopper oxidase family protein [Pseudomonas typographi]